VLLWENEHSVLVPSRLNHQPTLIIQRIKIYTGDYCAQACVAWLYLNTHYLPLS